VPDYLTRRNGFWQFVRRVPLEFAALDPRGVIKHSTKVEVLKDRRGTKAGKIADAMNRDLEAYWRGLSEGKAQEAADREPDYQQISDHLEAEDLLNMIQELPSGYRIVFNLYAIDGYSHSEISELMQIPIGTSKSNLSRARMLLQKSIKKMEEIKLCRI